MERFFTDPKALHRMRSGPLKEYVDLFAQQGDPLCDPKINRPRKGSVLSPTRAFFLFPQGGFTGRRILGRVNRVLGKFGVDSMLIRPENGFWGADEPWSMVYHCVTEAPARGDLQLRRLTRIHFGIDIEDFLA